MASGELTHKKPGTFGPGTIILTALSVFGLSLVVYRWIVGLGPTTGLTDGRGWGIWIGFDVLCGIALAAGAFSIAATVYIFHLKDFYPILRPTILTGFLGYALAAFSIAIDLGFPQRIWHLIIHWNIHSPLFEVGWCVMIYATVLALEISPIVFERFRLKTPLRLVRAITIPLVIAGIILSTCHQSSLGTLFVLMPHRVHPLWYSGLMPLLFLISAIGAGLSMVIVESTLSSSGLNHRLENHLLARLAAAIPYVLGLYLAIRIIDLVAAGDVRYLFTGDFLSISFWIENIVGVIVPIILFSMPSVTSKPYRLFGTALLVVIGLMVNRLYISLVAFNAGPYAPTWEEMFITIGLVALGALVFTLVSRNMPVFSEHEETAARKDLQEQPTPEMAPALSFSVSSPDQAKPV